MEAVRTIPREIDWAEAYVGGDYLLLRTSERRNHHLNAVIWRCAVREFNDFNAFFAEFGRMCAGREVVIALGDSNTAGDRAWPRRLAEQDSAIDEVAVLNLSDFDQVVDQQTYRLRLGASHPSLARASRRTVVYLGGLVDVERRLVYHLDFLAGRRSSPLLRSETELAEDIYGSEIARLLRQIPSDEDEAQRWIARRTVAAVKILDRICADLGHRFLAVLQPLCYQDLVPAYMQFLKRGYTQESHELTFEQWCAKWPFFIDADDRFKLPVRPYLDRLRDLWQREAAKSSHGRYIDAAASFEAVSECPYGDQGVGQDAVHYNDEGAHFIARMILSLSRDDV
ncbi:MAG TPA: hypothetical protein VGG22_05405 [Candidatus Baltobacteraceae bacterium]|jgi:hypothetical protein